MRPSTKKRIDTLTKRKYGNTIVKYEGEVFHSKGELKRWIDLKLLERAGKISDLKRQVVFELQPSFKYNGTTVRAMKYILDFTYIEDGKQICEDFKGYATPDNKNKQKLFKYKFGEYILRITTK